MIKTLRNKISILFTSLFAAIWILGLVMFNLQNHNNQIQELRSNVRSEISKGGWYTFYKTGGVDEAFDLEGLEYCIILLNKDGSISVRANYFQSIPVEELKEYVRKHKLGWKPTNEISKITYIHEYKRRYGKIVVLLSTETVFKSEIPLIVASLAAACFGIFILSVMMKKLSCWLVRPVEEAMQSEKDFISNASHELKTPLTVIHANTELLAEEIGENKHLQYIDTETKRLISLVNQMLELVRLDAQYAESALQCFRADEALLNVIYPMESVAFEKKIKLDIQVQDGIYLTGNEEQIQSLMSILLDNAISYTPMGGRITIYADIRTHKFHLTVANTGDPITPQQYEKLFQRFYRQDQARESISDHLGLGLSIAESIVKKHHGEIHAESVDGENIFYVTLPLIKK